MVISIAFVCIGVPLSIYIAGWIKYSLQKSRWQSKFKPTKETGTLASK
jgi:hypothetical protein